MKKNKESNPNRNENLSNTMKEGLSIRPIHPLHFASAPFAPESYSGLFHSIPSNSIIAKPVPRPTSYGTLSDTHGLLQASACPLPSPSGNLRIMYQLANPHLSVLFLFVLTPVLSPSPFLILVERVACRVSCSRSSRRSRSPLLSVVVVVRQSPSSQKSQSQSHQRSRDLPAIVVVVVDRSS